MSRQVFVDYLVDNDFRETKPGVWLKSVDKIMFYVDLRRDEPWCYGFVGSSPVNVEGLRVFKEFNNFKSSIGVRKLGEFF